MIPSSVRIPVPFDYVFPRGALFLSVDAQVDFDRLRESDNQARDETGTRLWVVKVMDLDPAAGRFNASTERKVKIAANIEPAAPVSAVPGYPPMVEFTDVTVTPYTDNGPCKGNRTPHVCRARLAWSIRATGMTEAALPAVPVPA